MADQRAIRRAELEEQQRRREDIRQKINDCLECDEYGRRDDLTDCTLHPNNRHPQGGSTPGVDSPPLRA